jgi:hypothetical protein
MRAVWLSTMAFVVACFGEVEPEKSADRASTASVPPPCDPPFDNPPECPEHFIGGAYRGEPCPYDGLECSYAGRGSGGKECRSSAFLYCSRRHTDGGGPVWISLQ